jgi:LAS superfamily LD-carboxypeptidase LdcB
VTAATGWRHGRIVHLDLVDVGDGIMLHRPVAAAFTAMRLAAKADGVDIVATQGWRSLPKQDALYRAYKDALAEGRPHAVVARPGWSNHQCGTTVDVETQGIHEPSYEWMCRRAHEFGFHRTVESERWHWEYLVDGKNIFDGAPERTYT